MLYKLCTCYNLIIFKQTNFTAMKKLTVLFLLLCFYLPTNAQKTKVATDSLKLQFLGFKDLDKKQKSVLPIFLYQVVSKNQSNISKLDTQDFKSLNYDYLKYQNILEDYAERNYLLEQLYPNINYYLAHKSNDSYHIGIPSTPPIRKN